MRTRLVLAIGIILGAVLLAIGLPAHAVITRLTPLREILANEKHIFVAKVETLDPDKPAVVLKVDEELKGKASFARLPVNLAGDSYGQREKHPAQLVKRLAPNLPVVVFTSARGKRYVAYGYTNGTWFEMIGHVEDDPAKVRWEFTHCEPYLRRTFKGTTAELRQVIRDGLDNKKMPPDPDPKEQPGLGPEVEKKESEGRGQRRLFAVIPTFVLVGPLALLAALFPAVFGGLMLVFKRWAVLLAVASLDSTIYLLYSWFRGSLKDSWWSTPLGLWTVLTLVALAGAVWSWRRYRAASPEERAVARVPRQGEKVILWVLSVIGLVIIVSCLLRGVLL